MSRPRKNPDYNAETIMSDFLKDVEECYEKSPKVSLRDVAAEFDITLLKVRKVLITAGVYSTDISHKVQELKEQGKTIEEIMDITGLSRASVHSYLPYKKGIYNAREVSLSTVVLAYQNMRQLEEIRRAKDLGTFGASYLYPIFLRLGVGSR